VLKKTCATGVVALAATAGALVTSSPASAQARTWGGGGCCSRFSHHRNFNFNQNDIFTDIPIRVHNRNNNIAIARNNQEQEERQGRFRRFGRDGLFEGGFGFDDD
jgi:hypothetical protein